MKFLILFFLLFSQTSFATTYLKGIIYKGSQFEALDIATLYNRGTKEPFPRKYYDTSGVFIQSLEYDNSVQNNDKKFDIQKTAHIFDFDDYVMLSTIGKLELVSYNSGTNQYKFKLSMLPASLRYYSKPGNSNISGKIKIKGRYEIYLTGIYDPNLNTLSPNNDQTMIAMKINDPKKRREETINFTIQENIPVQIELD